MAGVMVNVNRHGNKITVKLENEVTINCIKTLKQAKTQHTHSLTHSVLCHNVWPPCDDDDKRPDNWRNDDVTIKYIFLMRMGRIEKKSRNWPEKSSVDILIPTLCDEAQAQFILHRSCL